MKKILFFLILCIYSFNLIAQRDSPISPIEGIKVVSNDTSKPDDVKTGDTPIERIKVISSENFKSDDVIAEGVPTVRITKTKIKKSKEAKWEFVYSASGMSKDKKTTLHKKNELKHVATTHEEIHALFLDHKKQLTIYSINWSSLETKQLAFDFLGYNSISAVSAFDRQILLAINDYNKVVSIDLETAKLKNVSLKLKQPKRTDVKIKNFQYHNEKEAYLIFDYRKNRRKADAHVVKFNSDAKVERTFTLAKNTDLNLLDVSVFETKEGKHIFCGSYNSHKSRKVKFWEHLLNIVGIFYGSLITYDADVSEGIFVSQYGNKKLDFTKHYNHTNFESYRLKLNELELKKLDKKNAKNKLRGKQFLDNKNMIFHPLMPHKDGYLLLGENYMPTYTSSGYGRYSTKVFDGYQYGELFLARFDTEGNLLWDSELNNYCFDKPRKLVKKALMIKMDEGLAKIQTCNTSAYVDAQGNIGYSLDNDGKIIPVKSENGLIVKKPEVPQNRFFQESGFNGGISLPLFTKFGNVETAKLFDTYHFGCEGDFFLDSKPIFEKTKLRLNTGMFLYTNTITFFGSLASDPSNPNKYYFNYAGGIGVRAGTSLIFDDRLIVGASFPLGYGFTDDISKAIIGVTPSIQYVFTRIKTDMYLECRFPIWKHSLDNAPVGLIFVVGWTRKSYRDKKISKAKRIN